MDTRDLLEAAPPPPQKDGWKNWLHEIVALVLSTAALVSVAVLLATQNDNLVTDWNFPLSINTIVAILGVLNKATLAFVISACIGQHKWNVFKGEGGKLALFQQFDEASRGPLGGLGLMFRTRGLNWANLGALVLILSLAVDPFLQAAVKLVGKVSSVNDSNAVPTLTDGQRFDLGRLIEIEPPGIMDFDGTLPFDLFRQELDFGITAAIHDGLGRSVRKSNTDPKVPFQCSANCTWPAYTTASVCSRCNDVTSALVKKQEDKCTNENGTDQNILANVNMEGPCTTFSAANYGRIRQFDAHLLFENEQLADILIPGEAQFKVLLTANISQDYTQTVSFKDTETMFLSYLVMRVSDEFLRNETSWEDSTPSAEECGLYFCAKAYESKVENGNLVEKEVGVWDQRDPQSWRLLDDSSDDAKKFMDEHPSLGQTEHLRTDLVVTVPDGEVDGKVATRFSITQATIRGLQDSLKDITMYTTTEVDEDDSDITTEVTRPLVFPMSGEATFDYPLGELFWNSTNITADFDRLSNRLSVELRSSLPDKLSGTLHLYRIHIHVQWPYLTLPLLALFVGWTYFAMVTLQTRRLGIPVMKESVLPTLTYGLDESTREYLKTLEDGQKSGAKNRSNLRLGLTHGKDGGLQLGMTGDSPTSGRKWRSKTGVDSPDVVKPFPLAEEDGQGIGMRELRHVESAPSVSGKPVNEHETI